MDGAGGRGGGDGRWRGIHVIKMLVKMSYKHQYKALTDLTFVHFNYFSEAGLFFYAASSVTGIDSLICLCLLKVILFILMHKYGPLNVSLAL